jgi:hypothetical protein
LKFFARTTLVSIPGSATDSAIFSFQYNEFGLISSLLHLIFVRKQLAENSNPGEDPLGIQVPVGVIFLSTIFPKSPTVIYML